ncbi:flagellar motor switch phosphatase FliY [Ethanoligenens harbinense]|uniref:CheC, inhibitor of MCP methylation / FliN fusion protein n=1 Tax=Ethanoligenens harbinense (strain DSM 18485 / JCM 12961 / CGMCC 1.5033 / YUAN-3) TaxID=663278 RepID=E6U6I9_ETHHY|nr:flagellar motor switch phosphatase FliY [Ethanoligenens harbinense]ADU28059.1 CheC, inhibitor of MCP methylation / FliN fusion protein [Ethanoligenens harbinense YUAN-3]AVQ97074.1 flagellar motor switch phosphatase FliY [Ethanoligenens harbinense YUAN-3]AYF42569.1 flagellar motor switch phosphatase FliY [Ethanoligenens harbinense]QCN93317.1 flagellar motor switch phosphatase FliY [Ethanoligenens harbinense]
MSQNEGFVLTQDEKDILGEISNISMGSAATALSNILGQKVVITSPHVEKGSRQAIEDLEKIPSIGVIISYTEGVIGENFLIMRSADAAQIVNLLMGGDVESEEFGEIQISAIAEVMNQMMGGSATALSGFIGRTVNISPPSAFVLTEENKEEKLAFIYSQADQVVFVKFRFFVENMFESEIFMVMTRDFQRELVQAMLDKMGISNLSEMSGSAPEPPAAPQSEPPAPEPAAPPVSVAPAAPAAATAPVSAPTAPAASAAPAAARQEAAAAATAVRPAVLPQFAPQPVLSHEEQNNFELIQEVPLDLSVEVGRSRKLVREILDFAVGSIIELDKQAGDPVDIIVNGQLIAQGEVVVIDENFGVRITEIIGKQSKA